MGIISDSINKRRNLRSDDGAVTRAERAEHHNYQEELTAFGFVSPLVLPSDRLQELKGDMTLDEFANACHIKTREAEILIENPEMEPTTQQLLTTSYAFSVSVLWLLGYHTSKENGTRHFDRELLSLISRRNAAEDQAYSIKQKDRFRNLFITNISKRVYQLNLQISQTAARAVASDTPSMALAPRRDLLSVPSRSSMVLSTCTWRSASRPTIASAISVFTFSTALLTPLPL